MNKIFIGGFVMLSGLLLTVGIIIAGAIYAPHIKAQSYGLLFLEVNNSETSL